MVCLRSAGHTLRKSHLPYELDGQECPSYDKPAWIVGRFTMSYNSLGREFANA